MNRAERAELLWWAAKIHLQALKRTGGNANEDVSVREASRLIRSVNHRARMTRAQADYFDGVIPKEPKKLKRRGKK